MFYVLQNESTAALRRVPILLTDAATGTTAQTGLASTQIFPYVNINGGAFAGGAGTIAEAGYGQYYYEFDPTEVATLGLAGIHITAVGCRDYDAICQVAAFNVYSGAGAGITAGDVWDYIVNSGDSASVTVSNAAFYANNASSQTSGTSIRDAVWDTDISYLDPSTQAGGILYQAANGATTAGSQVWSYVLSDTNTAETDLVNAAAGGAGITAGDVWNFPVLGFGVTNSAAEYLTGAYTDSANTYTQLVNNTAADVWTYTGIPGRTITGGIADTVTSVINTVDISTQSVTDIWSEDVSGYSNPSAGYDLTQAASGGAGISAGDVWNYTLLSSGQSADATLGNVDTNVTTIQGNTSNIPADVWSYATRTLTSGGGITAGDVWSYGTRTLTSGSGITAGDVSNAVWGVSTASYTTNGTYGKLVLRSDQASKAGDVSLASSGGVNRVDADIHAIVNDTAAATSLKNALTGVGASWTGNITGNVTGSVNSVTSDVNVSTSSMSGIANTVWSAGTKTITGGTVDNVTNPVAVSTTSMSGIAGTVWTNGTRTITGGIADTVSTVTGPVSVSTTSMTGIAGTVWSYTPRTITSGGGATAGDIWTYQIDTITTSGTAAAQLNDAAVSGSVVTIVNGPYRVTSTAEGSDGVIDILADSIQPITIYCINGFGQPFNIGGYTASVDIYDEAGGFVRSYTPTIDYALGGILTFNIDADVTAVIGRYTLVVSLTDGDVIQLGPLTILVRPL